MNIMCIKYKNILSTILIIIFLTGTLPATYADSGPVIGENQAKKIAQNYLNSHNLPYKATIPIHDDWRIKVKDIKTGQIEWIAYTTYKAQFCSEEGIREPLSTDRYQMIKNNPTLWFVYVYNSKKRNIGTIYVESETGKVLSSNLKKHKITRHKHVVKKPKYKVKKHKRQNHKVHKHKIKLRKH